MWCPTRCLASSCVHVSWPMVSGTDGRQYCMPRRSTGPPRAQPVLCPRPRPPPLTVANGEPAVCHARASALGQRGNRPKIRRRDDASTPQNPSLLKHVHEGRNSWRSRQPARPLAGRFPFNCRVSPELNHSIHWTTLSVAVTTEATHQLYVTRASRDPVFFTRMHAARISK